LYWNNAASAPTYVRPICGCVEAQERSLRCAARRGKATHQRKPGCFDRDDNRGGRARVPPTPNRGQETLLQKRPELFLGGIDVDEERFGRAVYACEFVGGDFPVGQPFRGVSQGDFGSAHGKLETKYENVTFPLAGFNNRGRERIAENIRLETLLLGIPHHDNRAVEFADGPLGMKMVEDGVATWPEFALVNASVNTAVRGHGRFGIGFGVLPGSHVEFGELLHFGKR